MARHLKPIELPVDELDSWLAVWTLLEFCSSKSNRGWLFRGVDDFQYGLRPKIGRPRGNRAGHSGSYSFADEKNLFQRFCREAGAFLGPTTRTPSTELEWLALGQHYGLPTRFLDWTESLLVALWFAADRGVRGKDSAVWVLWEHDEVRSAPKPFSVASTKGYRPPLTDPRMVAQRSVFTLHHDPQTDYVPATSKKLRVPGEQGLLAQEAPGVCGYPRCCGLSRFRRQVQALAWLYKWGFVQGIASDESDENQGRLQ